MKNQKKFAELIECIYKDEKALREKIEKGIIDILKANDLTSFRFENPICISNSDDIDNDGKVFGVHQGVLDTDETQECLFIEAAWQYSDYEIEDDYYATDFYIDDLVEIIAQLYSQIK